MMRTIIITISEMYLKTLHIVAENLREEGVTIVHVYKFGVIVGIADNSTIDKIRNHKEIESLTDEKKHSIPPPKSPIE